MQKVIVTIGAPGSGKTTWSRELMKKEPNIWKHINNDSLREALDFSHYSKSNEDYIRKVRKYLIVDALLSGYNVIVDNVNPTKKHFEEVCELVKSLNVDVTVQQKLFYLELEELIERDKQRLGVAQVGEEVVKKFFKLLGGKQFKLSQPKTETFLKSQDTVSLKQQDKNLPPAIICDLDGTLALFNAKDFTGKVRKTWVKAHTRNPYDASECENDAVNPAVLETITLFNKHGYRIVFLSGRDDKYESQTRNWLNSHISFDYDLYLRQDKDKRKDTIFKQEVLETKILPNYKVLYALDDRDSVVQWYREYGIPCFQVAPGSF